MISLKLNKKITDTVFRFRVFFKSFFPKAVSFKQNFVEDYIIKYENKERVVVFCSGPSANNAIPEKTNLYLATNDGYKFMVAHDLDYLFYLNDQNYINKNLVIGKNYLKDNQEIILFYAPTALHKKGWKYLKKKLWMFGNKSYISFNDLTNGVSKSNYEVLMSFYKHRAIPVKVQNSGMFLLLLGYYIAVKLNKPLDIYGLDLGLGGNMHFDKKDVLTKSITRDRVKANTKMYLDYIYENHFDVKNYSNFYGNITGFKEK